MTRLLLDTHVLLWALAAPSRLAPATRRLLDRAEVFASAASIWEISIKAALGKLAADPADVIAAVEPAGFSPLAITGEHAARVVMLPGHHRDPFDRMLVAQALSESMQLLTSDRALLAYGAFVTRV